MLQARQKKKKKKKRERGTVPEIFGKRIPQCLPRNISKPASPASTLEAWKCAPLLTTQIAVVYKLSTRQRPCGSTGTYSGNVKRRKLAWVRHVTRHDSLSKTTHQGTLKGGRRRGRQRKCWMKNIKFKEWISLPMQELITRASWQKGLAENLCRIVPQVSPRSVRRPSRTKDWTELNMLGTERWVLPEATLLSLAITATSRELQLQFFDAAKCIFCSCKSVFAAAEMSTSQQQLHFGSCINGRQVHLWWVKNTPQCRQRQMLCRFKTAGLGFWRPKLLFHLWIWYEFWSRKSHRQLCRCEIDYVAAKLPPVFVAARVKLQLQSAQLQQQNCVYSCKRTCCSDKMLQLQFSD